MYRLKQSSQTLASLYQLGKTTMSGDDLLEKIDAVLETDESISPDNKFRVHQMLVAFANGVQGNTDKFENWEKYKEKLINLTYWRNIFP